MPNKLPNKTLLSITQAAEILGVSPDTLRRLDKKGKVKARRNSKGKRFYTPKDIEVLKQIFQGEGPYTPTEAASILNVSVDTLRRWDKKGKIKSYRTPGGHRRFTKKAIEAVKGTKHETIEEKPKDGLEEIKKDLEEIKKERKVKIIERKPEEPKGKKAPEVIRLIHSEKTKIRETLPLNFVLIGFVVVSSLLIGIAQLAGAVSEKLTPSQVASDVPLEGQVLAVETEGGSAVLLSQVLDENFNLSLNGYVEGNQIRSTTTDSAPLSVETTTKVEDLNVDLLDGNDFSDLPTLITGTVNSFSLTTSGTQLKLSTSTSDPTALGSGSLYFNSSTNKIKVYNGTSWENVDAGTFWTDGGGYVYPTDGEKLGNDSSGGSNKISGIYLSDSSPVYFGTDNDWNVSAGGSDLGFSDGSNTLFSMKDKGSHGFFNIKGKSSTADPSSCAEGDIYYNATDDTLRVCHSSNTWEALDGEATSISFTNITTGTNSSATMTVDTGSSLTYSGSGSINASTLNSIASGSFLRSDTSDSYTSGTLDINSGTTLDINGDLSVADTDIQFDGASTQFTTTGVLTLSLGSSLDIDSGTIDLSSQTVDVTLNNAVDALNFDSNTLSINASNNRVGIGTNSPDVLLHLFAGSAGLVTPPLDADNFVIESNSDTGMSIFAANTFNATLNFGVDGSSNLAEIRSESLGSNLVIESAGTVQIEAGSGDEIVVNDTGSNVNLRIEGDTDTNLLFSEASTDSIGIGTSGPDAKLDSLSTTGEQLRLTYTDGSVYTGFTTNSSGNLSIDPTGAVISSDADMLPSTNNTYDLGSASLQWAEIRGVALYQNGNVVCDDSGNCTGGDSGPWNETSGVVHLDTASNLVSIGDSTTEHKLEVEGAITGKALTSLWEKGDQDILVASNSATPANVFRLANDGSIVSAGDAAINGGDITTTQTIFNLVNTTATTLNIGGAATTLELGAASGTSSINNSLTVDGNTTLGDAITDSITFTARAGSDLLPISDNTYDLGSASLQWAEIRGVAIYQNGNQVCDSTGANCPSGGDAGPWNETTGIVHLDTTSNLVAIGASSTDFKLGVEGAVTGKALVGLNETGDQNILTASASGTPRLSITNGGNLQFHQASSITTTTGNLTIDSAGDTLVINDGIVDLSTQTVDVTLNAAIDALNFDSNTLSIDASSDRVGIGTAAPGESLEVSSGNIRLNGSTGNWIGFQSGNALTWDSSNGPFMNSTGNYVINLDSNNDDSDTRYFAVSKNASTFTGGTELFRVNEDGSAGLSGAFNAGSTTTVAYSRLGTGTTGHSGNLAAASDLLLQDLEVDGTLFLDSGTLANSDGTASLVLTATPITSENKLSASSWLVENTANVGKAALIVNQQKGGDIFTASASGSTRFTIENDGDVTFGDGSGTDLTVGGGTGKIDVGTVDPVYNIGGTKYATYMAGMIGVKEEVTGSVNTTTYIPGVGYKQTIEFVNQQKGSDLWLFAKATDIQKHIENLVVLLSPSGNTRAWYRVNPDRYSISIYTSRPTTVSYRLTAPRFDAALWTNYNDNPNSTGFIVEDKELEVNGEGNIKEAEDSYLDSLSIENSTRQGFFENENLSEFNLLDSTGNLIHQVEALSKFVGANIKAGAIETKLLATKRFYAFQGTIDNLLITSGLVSPSVKTANIAPLPEESNVSITLGNEEKESGFGELIIKSATGSSVAKVDSRGNAEFEGRVKADSFEAKNASLSGELYANKIYAEEIVNDKVATQSATTLAKIEELLKKAEEDQKLLAETKTWDVNTATDSADLSSLTTSSLYVTNSALVSSLSISDNLTLGSDFVIENNTINSLEKPLKIQHLALAPVEIMDGKVKIDTKGNVHIDGNLTVAGRIEAKEAVLSSTEASDIFSVKFGEEKTAAITSQGSGSFSSIQTGSLRGGENIRDSISVSPGQTTLPIQKEWAEAPVSVLVTPSYSTQAWVTEISEQGFTINLDQSPGDEQKVFWWAVW